MIDIINIELYKLYKTKKYAFIIALMTITIIFTFIMGYSIKETRYTHIAYLYNIFAANHLLLFPIIITILFSSTIIDEFNDNTIKLLNSSRFGKQEIVLGKLIANCICFSSIFIVSISIYVIFTSILFNINGWDKYLFLSKQETIKRFLLVFISEIIYLNCFAAFISLMSWTIKRKYVVIFIGIIIPIIFRLMAPLPSWIENYIFIEVSRQYYSLVNETFEIIPIIRSISISITTMIIFVLAMILRVYKQEM